MNMPKDPFEDPGALAEAECDAINAAQPKVDQEAIGLALLDAEALARVGGITMEQYLELRRRIRAAISEEDDQTWREYAESLRARCLKR